MPYRGDVYDAEVVELDASSESEPGPGPDVGVTLLPHQRRALCKCRRLEDNNIDQTGEVFMQTSIGVYGDPVGSGKSHVMLALIVGDAREQGAGEPRVRMQTYAEGRIMISELETIRPIKTSVIVVPHTLASQWESYLQPLSLNVMVVNRMKAVDRLSAAALGELDVILVNNSFYSNIAHLLIYRGVKPRRVIIDEADSIVLPSTICIKAAFTWFVTSSYQNLILPMGTAPGGGISRHGFIRVLFLNLYNSMTRAHTKRIVVRSSDAAVQASMQSRSVIQVMVRSMTAQTKRLMACVVDRMVMHFLDAGDIDSAVDQVAQGNVHDVEQMVALMTSRYTVRLLAAESAMDACMREGSWQEALRQTGIVQELHHKISCLDSRLHADDVCCICLDRADVDAVVPCCATKMCLECIARWVLMKSTCVLCRSPLRFDDLHVIRPTSSSSSSGASSRTTNDPQTYGQHNSQLQNMEVIFDHHVPSTSKTLIYCDQDADMSQVLTSLTRHGRTFDNLRGGHRQVSNTVEAYKDGRLDVLLMSAAHYGIGLNLENTTDVILFGPISNEVMTQVIGRAQRMGRTSDLKVWHLILEDA